MKTPYIVVAAVAAVILIAGTTYMVDVEQTEEAALPEVSIEGGNMPEFDAEVGDVSVGETTVTVPTLEIESPEEERRAESGFADTDSSNTVTAN
ncbi:MULTISPECIES: hypothetical protein [unclassified Dinoroseobacter]|uniref:hypothetical protein n=1 Tax=unclassified Dinoroseobacter TaxID=2620028 RepID=UPI003C7ED738